MPELPEVETVRRTLAPLVEGRRLLRVRFLSPLAAAGQTEALTAKLTGARVERCERWGKHLLLRFEHGTLDIHLRMTGKLLWGAAPGPYARAVLQFDHGAVVFEDVRQFGRMVWREGAGAPPGVGPDLLGLDEEAFAARLRGRRGRVKPVLLNQAVVAGLGNIYVDEALFRARVHPLARVERLGARRVGRVHEAVQSMLAEAVAAGGSSISDYVDAQGREGAFQRMHQVYGRAGAACPVCGAAVRRIVVAQRGTHFCAACQRR
jgi:formamidopyrimidine-DNA glycosylase